MEGFEVKLHGENFYFNREGKTRKFGFYTRRLVRAGNFEEAGRMALKMVCRSSLLAGTLIEEKLLRPVIHLVQVRKVNPLAFLLKKSDSQIEFYPEEG